MTKQQNKKPLLPDQIYVIKEREGNNYYLIAQEDVEGFSDNDIVGIYERIATKTLAISRDLL